MGLGWGGAPQRFLADGWRALLAGMCLVAVWCALGARSEAIDICMYEAVERVFSGPC